MDTIPVLIKGKEQTLNFFRSAGVAEELLSDLQSRLVSEPQLVNKYQIARTVLRRLNEGGDRYLAPRREVVRRVVEWEDFSLSWPNEQDKARGLVATIRQMVNVKDSFTRIQQERDKERAERLRNQAQIQLKKQARRDARASLRTKMVEAKNESNPQRRGKLLEKLLAELCAVEGIQVREPFEIRKAGSPEEQIDGLITAGSHLYLVEVKWWNDPIEITAMSAHLLRLFRRPDARGLFVSVSGFTEPAKSACRDVLSERLMVLAELNELIFLLEGDRAVSDWLERKAQMVVSERDPSYVVTDI